MSKKVEFKDVQFHLIKWAIHFLKRNKYRDFELWELINSAWMEGRIRNLPKGRIKLASNCARWDIASYIRKRLNKNKYQKNKKIYEAEITNLDFAAECGETNTGEFFLARPEHSKVETEDFFNKLPVPSRKRLMLKLWFIDGLTMREIGRLYEISGEAVRLQIKHTLLKLKRNSRFMRNFKVA